jgi:hypothetical protein
MLMWMLKLQRKRNRRGEPGAEAHGRGDREPQDNRHQAFVVVALKKV